MGINRLIDFTKNYANKISTLPSTITNVLNAGTDVELQAYRDIDIISDIVVGNVL